MSFLALLALNALGGELPVPHSDWRYTVVESSGPTIASGDAVGFLVIELNVGADLNGDGDQGDIVAHYYRSGTGEIINTGLALSVTELYLEPDVDGQGLLGFSVGESVNGQTDINGDGDAKDEILHLVDTATGEVHNTLLQHAQFQTLGAQGVVRKRSEFIEWLSEGGTAAEHDLNGDGDTADSFVSFSETGSQAEELVELPFGLQEWAHHGDCAAVPYPESAYGDSNGDGDADDFVRLVHTFGDGSSYVLPLASSQPSPAACADPFLILVDEAGQGASDLNGDGDLDDAVLHFHDPVSRATLNLGLAAIDLRPTEFGAVFRIVEGEDDLNSDGDVGDAVLHAYSSRDRQLYNTGFAGEYATGGLGALVVRVSELEQGEIDLDGDGSVGIARVVLRLPDLLTLVLPLGEEGITVARGARAVHVVEETAFGSDLNGDGLVGSDSVLFEIDMTRGAIDLAKFAVIGEPEAIAMGADSTLVVVPEDSSRIDVDGDGAFDGRFVRLLEPTGRPLDLPVPTPGTVAAGDRFYALAIVEDDLDLNGDGDTGDNLVVFLRRE